MNRRLGLLGERRPLHAGRRKDESPRGRSHPVAVELEHRSPSHNEVQLLVGVGVGLVVLVDDPVSHFGAVQALTPKDVMPKWCLTGRNGSRPSFSSSISSSRATAYLVIRVLPRRTSCTAAILARTSLASAVSHHRVTSSARTLAETSMPANLLASQTVDECTWPNRRTTTRRAAAVRHTRHCRRETRRCCSLRRGALEPANVVTARLRRRVCHIVVASERSLASAAAGVRSRRRWELGGGQIRSPGSVGAPQ